MFNNRLLFFLLLLLPLILVIIGGCSPQPFPTREEALAGVLELTPWHPEDGLVSLDGEWEFYWAQLLEPGEFREPGLETDGYVNLPGSWNGYMVKDERISGQGYATYRLNLKTEEGSRLALKIPRILTSYNMWINGELVASAGRVGTNREEMTPQYLPQIAIFEGQPENEIVIQVANFYHRSGGILEGLILGSEKQVLDLKYKRIANALFLFGSLIIIGGYHLALFFFRKKDPSPLYFGLFSIFVGVRTLVVGEIFFIHLFPGFNWEAAHKIQTLTFYLGLPLIMMFFKAVFPNEISGKMVRFVQVVGLAFGGLVLFTPARIFSVFNPAYQAFTLVVIMYMVYFLVIILNKKETGANFIVVGALAMIITTLYDMVFLSIWMSDHGPPIFRTFFRSGNLSSFGQLIFVFTHSLFLAQNYSLAFKKEEVMTEELKEMNLNLDKLVRKRTLALEKSREKIEYQKTELEKSNRLLQHLSRKDPLTGLWNRRHLDETMEMEWRRCLRHQRAISLLMVDIDFFKVYNDCFGHKAGDECLVQIAQTIEASFSRGDDLVARYGGEEFVVIMAEVGKGEAERRAHFLQQTIEELKIPHTHFPGCSYVTVSIGVASMLPTEESSPKDLFLEADKALYRAKAAGRNQVKSL